MLQPNPAAGLALLGKNRSFLAPDETRYSGAMELVPDDSAEESKQIPDCTRDHDES